MILRNPVDRAYSHYHHAKKLNREYLSFEDAIKYEEDRLKQDEQFIRETYNDNVEHRIQSSFVRKTYSYLRRGHYAEYLKEWIKVFPKNQMLILNMDELISDRKSFMKKVFKHIDVQYIDIPEENRNVGGYKTKMSDAMRKKLIKYFKPHNKELEKLLGKKLNWDK